MAFGQIDLNDSLVSPFFVLASGVQADLFDLVLFGFDFSSVILTLGSGAGAVEITAARLLLEVEQRRLPGHWSPPPALTSTGC